MNELLFSKDMTVARALQQGRSAAKVFIQQKAACVGCYLTGFCTLEDVAAIYGLPLEVLLRELQHSSKDKTTLIRSKNETAT